MKKVSQVLAVLVLAFGLSNGCKDKSKSAGEIHGTITFIRGNVMLNQAPAQIGAKISMNDNIDVKDKSTAVVQFSTNAMITIESNTNLVVKNLLMGKDGVPNIALDQSRGSTFNKIVPGKANYTVNTPTITAGVRGTAFRVSSTNSGNGTSVELYTGKVALTKEKGENKTDKEVILEAGQMVEITETEIKAPVQMGEAKIKDLEKLNEISMLPEKNLDKIETISTVSEKEAKEIQQEADNQVVPESSHKILMKMEEESKPEITYDDLRKQFGSLSKVTTKNGKTYIGGFKQVGGKMIVTTVNGQETIPTSELAKVEKYEE